jgi:hypothetical protein
MDLLEELNLLMLIQGELMQDYMNGIKELLDF